MYKVTFLVYGKRKNEYLFETYEEAKRFFHKIRKAPSVTRAELEVLENA